MRNDRLAEGRSPMKGRQYQMELYFHPNTEAFIRAGYEPSIHVISVSVSELDADVRALLAKNYRRLERDGRSLITVDAPTLDAIVAAFRAEEAAENAKLAEAAAKRAALIAEAHAVIAERKTKETHRSVAGPFTWEESAPAWPWGVGGGYASTVSLADVIADTDGRQWLDDLARLNLEREAAAQAAFNAHRDALSVERAKESVVLREWATDHGSVRVKMLLEEQHKSWDTLAVDEFLDAHTPAGFAKLPGRRPEVRTKPTEADILALRQARALAEASPHLVDPQLAFLSGYRKATDEEINDEYTEVDEEGDVLDEHAAVGLTVTAPYGTTRQVWRRIEQQ